MHYTLHSTTVDVDGHQVPVSVDSWLTREQIETAVGAIDLEGLARQAVGDALHGWTDEGPLRGSPERCDVTVYLAHADDGGELRTIPTVVVRSPAETADDDLDLVGAAEAAHIAGISRAALLKAHQRGNAPQTVPVAGSDVLVWRRADVQRWAEQRPGRGRPQGA